jgi:DNA-binding NarL/FixJ family response regulator
LAERSAHIPSAVVVEDADADHFYRLMQLGVRGVLPARISPVQLIAALRTISLGQIVLDPAVVPFALGFRNRGAVLSARQERIVDLLAKGMHNNLIIQRLAISNSTLKRELQEIRAKLGIKDRTEIVMYGINSGYGQSVRSGS